MKQVLSPVDVEARGKLPITPGDTVRVWQKIIEREVDEKSKKVKERSRLQAFEGLVIARKHGREAGATFTLRKNIDGIGVERIFPLYSPLIDKIEIIRRAKVRRAKLYHIRKKAAKEIRRQMRNELKINDDKISARQLPDNQQKDDEAQGGENRV
jgi:large subunit ribosomal protein L19